LNRFSPVLFEEQKDAFVEDVNGRDGNLGVLQVLPSVSGMAIDDRLQIDFVNTIEVARHEGVDSDKLTSKVCLDMSFPELRIETLKETDFLF